MTSFVSASHLAVSLDDKQILKDIDIHIKRGEFISIVGPYGSGKTTLLKVIAGLLSNYSGEITVDGSNPEDLRNAARIGYCFQKPTLLPWLNVQDNLLLPAQLSHKKPHWSPKKLLAIINKKNLLLEDIDLLSGGTQQLISILRSISLNPDLLILDEPFAAIDEISREDLQQCLLSIHNETAKTTIMVTHSVNEAVFLSDRIIILTNKPATIKEEVSIQIDRGNKDVRASDAFFAYTKQIRGILHA